MKVVLIGFGKWGKILFKNLKKITKELIIIKKRNLTKLDQNVNWAIVSTQDQKHFKIVKKYLENNINVFCEKPITRNESQTKQLYKIAEKKNIYLIENQYYFFFFKKFTYFKKKINTITREKKDKKIKIKEILYRLTYHDLLLFYPYIKDKKLTKINFIEFKNNKLIFVIYFDQKLVINFNYNLNNQKKIHKINNVLLKTNKNILLEYIKNLFANKVDYKENKLRSLYIINLLNRIEKNLKKIS
jgi:hypothetical protein